MNISKPEGSDAYFLDFDMESMEDKRETLMISDVHFDSKKCDRNGLKKIMDEAVKRDATIFIFGDWLDVMGAKYDPRSGKSDIRPEYQNGNYFESVVDDSVKFLKPYADRLAFICQGNHELSVKKRHEIDLLSVISYKLKAEAGWTGLIGEYEGWLVFRYAYGGVTRIGCRCFYTHGTGGNAPVTRGVIQTNRRQVSIDADLYISGHIHTQWAMPTTRRQLTQSGVEHLREALHLQLGTFKESHKDRSGWEAMKGFSPPSIGGYWVRFFVGRRGDGKELRFIEERTMI